VIGAEREFSLSCKAGLVDLRMPVPNYLDSAQIKASKLSKRKLWIKSMN
jgi:hypothetical protein